MGKFPNSMFGIENLSTTDYRQIFYVHVESGVNCICNFRLFLSLGTVYIVYALIYDVGQSEPF